MPDGEHPTIRSPAASLAVFCPLCQRNFLSSEYDNHLRLEHGLFTYRGVRRTKEDTLEAARDDLLGPHFREAWPMMVQFAREQARNETTFLLTQLLMLLSQLPEDLLPERINNLSSVLTPDHVSLLVSLIESNQPLGIRLALTALATHAANLPESLLRTFRHLLVDSVLPETIRLDALALGLSSLNDPDLTDDFLRKLIAKLGKARGLEWLVLVSQRLDRHPVVLSLIGKLESRVRLSCPRCGLELQRREMVAHLWQQHRLLLDGLRGKDPWNLIEEWLASSKSHGDEGVKRSKAAAEKIDPVGGMKRLAWMLLQRGLADEQTRESALAEAKEKHSACCPGCFSLVPVPREEPPIAFQFRGHHLTGGGFRIVIDEHGLYPRLMIYTPEGLFLDIAEPDRNWTPRGAAFLAAGFTVLLALFSAIFWPVYLLGGPVRPTAVLLIVAAMLYVLVWRINRNHNDVRSRLLDHAWHELIARIPTDSFHLADSAMVAGIAQLSSRLARLDVPDELLDEWTRKIAAALERGQAPPGHLAALVRLRIERVAAEEEDPVPLVVTWLTRCFEGKFPLLFGQYLLEDWATDWWTGVNLARLRILLCDRAFEAGFEVRGLVDAGRNAPALGTVLGTGMPRSLAALRLIWSMRASRPWDRLGDVRTAFQIAADPELAHELEEHRDLLLWQQDSAIEVAGDSGRGNSRPATVCLTLSGVWLQDSLFIIPPRIIEVRRKLTGHEMILGAATFRGPRDLEPLSRLMERWFRWVFHEFLPQVDGVGDWRSPDRSTILRATGAVNCPGCGRGLLVRVGEVGVALENRDGSPIDRIPFG